jgi:hypothetical protein
MTPCTQHEEQRESVGYFVMNSEEYQNRLTHALTGLETRLGKDMTRRFYEKVTSESRDELEYVGAMEENALLDRVLWKLETKLNLLIEREMI